MTKKEFFEFIEKYGQLSPKEIEKGFRYVMDFEFDGDTLQFRAFETWSDVIECIKEGASEQDFYDSLPSYVLDSIDWHAATDLYFRYDYGSIEDLSKYQLNGQELDFIDENQLKTFLESKNQTKQKMRK